MITVFSYVLRRASVAGNTVRPTAFSLSTIWRPSPDVRVPFRTSIVACSTVSAVDVVVGVMDVLDADGGGKLTGITASNRSRDGEYSTALSDHTSNRSPFCASA